MKSFINYCLLIIACLLLYQYRYEVVFFVSTINFESKNSDYQVNNYYRDFNFDFVQNYPDITLYKKEDITNSFYTILNKGYPAYNIKCDYNYKSCLKDFEDILGNQDLLSNVNNFVHPYNSFEQLTGITNGVSNIKIEVNKIYDDHRISIINTEVDRIYNELITDSMSTRDKIKKIHDYIINNTTYDSVRAEEGNSQFSSNTAYGVLFEKKGICSGYSDTMALFLDKMNILNYRIASAKHIWNYVYLDDTWLHLDLTWDDPVSSDGRNHLSDSFFLINTKKLHELDTTEHTFDFGIYQEGNILK